MKKTLSVLLCLALLFGMTGCTPSCNDNASKLRANIDAYWVSHDLDGALERQNNSEADLFEKRAEFVARYGENKEILGTYDENLAADTASGIYVGKKNADNILSWKGIPYAKQPVGNLRWKAPQKPDDSDKVYEAYYFGHSSMQAESIDEPSSLYPQGEDCLNLNVWNNLSDSSKNKPIMVWIHGGAYIQGGSCDPIYDGTNFVKNHPDVIYASFDYRTDFLGVINLSKVTGAEDYVDTANLGLLDEIQALSWLKENAASFGGDPERITIFGESAGGGSVSSLTLAPQAKGLFKRAIMQSGVSSGLLRTAKKSIEHTDLI
ncbi:MAG: carboxylesterase family protein, partial [Clostridia bacterium]|nr:carboxylesterase family protein [Clostridia bacterium]